jgi:hypothetical protein
MRYWKVSYMDGLQGKSHEVVVEADSRRQALQKVEHLAAWQQPYALQAIQFNQPKQSI